MGGWRGSCLTRNGQAGAGPRKVAELIAQGVAQTWAAPPPCALIVAEARHTRILSTRAAVDGRWAMGDGRCSRTSCSKACHRTISPGVVRKARNIITEMQGGDPMKTYNIIHHPRASGG